MICSPATRMEAVQSPIIPIVGELIRSHPGTISLGQGVVNYPPPAAAVEAIAEFLKDPQLNKYQQVEGIPELREEFARKLNAYNHITPDRESEIIVTAGGNMAFMNAVLAIGDQGDEFILPTPYYFNHEMAITMAGCKPVPVPTTSTYQLDLDAINSSITSRTRAIVTVSPNNPTGAVYPADLLRAVNQICRKRNIYHISDEAYDGFVYGATVHFSPASLADSSPHTISLYSLSKVYGFASWRIGCMVIPSHLSTAVRKIQDTILICPPVISQYAAVGAMRSDRGYVATRLAELERVRELVRTELDQLSSFCRVSPSDGAFYFFLHLDTGIDPLELVRLLIESHHVAAIPGSAFGMDQGCYLRVAYGALERETVREGIGRLVRGLTQIIGAKQ